MTTSFKTYPPREVHEDQDVDVVTTVLPPIVTTSYNSPLSYPVHSSYAHQTHQTHQHYQPGQRYQPPQEQPQRSQQSRLKTHLINSQEQSHIPSKLPQSRIEYVPYERKKTGYETRQIVEKVPVERTIVEYQAVKKINYVPKEKVITDYYVVEHQTAYIPRSVEEKIIEYVPIETYGERVEYKPVEKQILHYPKDCDPTTAAAISARHSNIAGTVGFSSSVAQSSKLESIHEVGHNQVNQTQTQTQTANQSKANQSQLGKEQGSSVLKQSAERLQKKSHQQGANLFTTFGNQPQQPSSSLGQFQGIPSQFEMIPSNVQSFQSINQTFAQQPSQLLVNSFGIPYQGIIFSNEFPLEGFGSSYSSHIPNQFQNQLIFHHVSQESIRFPPLIPGLNISQASQFSAIPQSGIHSSLINLSYPPQQFVVVQQSETLQEQPDSDTASENSNQDSSPISSERPSEQEQNNLQTE